MLKTHLAVRCRLRLLGVAPSRSRVPQPRREFQPSAFVLRTATGHGPAGRGGGAALLLGAGSGAAAHGAARAAWGVQLGGQSQTRVAVTRASEQTS